MKRILEINGLNESATDAVYGLHAQCVALANQLAASLSVLTWNSDVAGLIKSWNLGPDDITIAITYSYGNAALLRALEILKAAGDEAFIDLWCMLEPVHNDAWGQDTFSPWIIPDDQVGYAADWQVPGIWLLNGDEVQSQPIGNTNVLNALGKPRFRNFPVPGNDHFTTPAGAQGIYPQMTELVAAIMAPGGSS